jgi:hypothetical protein
MIGMNRVIETLDEESNEIRTTFLKEGWGGLSLEEWREVRKALSELKVWDELALMGLLHGQEFITQIMRVPPSKADVEEKNTVRYDAHMYSRREEKWARICGFSFVVDSVPDGVLNEGQSL